MSITNKAQVDKIFRHLYRNFYMINSSPTNVDFREAGLTWFDKHCNQRLQKVLVSYRPADPCGHINKVFNYTFYRCRCETCSYVLGLKYSYVDTYWGELP